MSDSPTDPLAFEPVPSASNRHDGWTPERQRHFIYALGQLGMVAAAARCVGMSRKSAYELLKRAGADSGFARAWAYAQAYGRVRADFAAVERAVNGVEVPIFYRGKQCGVKRVYNDRLLMIALRAARQADAEEERRLGGKP